MKHIKKFEIKLILIAAIIITALTAGIVRAISTDVTDVEDKGVKAIGDTFSLNIKSIKNKTNTYCIQHHKIFRNGKKEFVVDKYVKIDGKTATIYDSSDSSGKEVKSKYNAIVAYIFSQKQGYGTPSNYTDGQKALWYYTNDWVNALFGDENDYNWSKNDEVSVKNNDIVEEAKEYASNIGNTTSKTDGKKLEMTDLTPNKDNLKKIDLGDGYYRIGPFKWEFEGTLKSIKVQADGNEVTDIRFVKYDGDNAEYVNVKDIESGDKFYVDIKDAKDISSVHLNLKTVKKIEVKTVKVWFLKSAKEYQNLVHVLPETKTVESSGEENRDYTVKKDAVKVGLQKVDDREGNTPLSNVGFIFRAQVQSYDLVEKVKHYHEDTGKYWWTENVYEWRTHTMYLDGNDMWNEDRSAAKEYKTNGEGLINVPNITFKATEVKNRYLDDDGTTISAKYANDAKITAIETSNPYYGYIGEIGKEYPVNSVNETKQLDNHQKYVKLSGYVWLEENQGKTTIRNNLYDNGVEQGVNGIKVYLKDKSGNIIKTATTSELGLYDINGGEYQFVDVDLDELQAGNYYVEFEYGGITYQSVTANLKLSNGSKAVDTNSRNILDNKFAKVDGNGSQSLNVNGVTVNYNANSNYVSTVNNYVGDTVYARTDEAGFNIYSNFEPTKEEIRNINLGLFEKEQTDYALVQDLYNVRVEVNGKSHIYRYATVRYNGDNINEENSWNIGVKFQRNTGTYSRAIYRADAEYTTSNKDKELKVYTTYKIALKNESPYLARINNIVDYCDNRMTLVHAGTAINDQDVISGELNFAKETYNNDKYSKYRIDTNAVIEQSEAQFIYVQFEVNREAVLSLMNNGEMINNVAEINSYTTFKDNNVNTPVSVVDKDSVPGNIIPGQINTYEDDTDAAQSLKLELKNARAMTGTVFVDSTGKDSNTVYKNEERKGNGIFDNGETTLKDIEVRLIDVATNQVTKIYDETTKTFVDAVTKTDDNGNFEFVGFVPGDYEVVYIWGDETYKVQYYKGTIYNENRTTVTQGNKYWYRGNTEGFNDDVISSDMRATDALDNYKIREAIDNEMEKVTTNTLEKQIADAYKEGYNAEGKNISITKMESTTPEMSISVEYQTTITDGTDGNVKFAINNIDFGIVERPKQQLELSKQVSAYKITLANGQILADVKIENGKMVGTQTNTIYMGPTANSNGLIRTEIDNELIEGATLEVTYTITFKNVGEIDYTSDKYYYYGNANGAEMVKVSAAQILDYVDQRLSVVDDNWNIKDLTGTFLKDYNVSEKDNTEYINQIRAYITEKLANEYLAPDESKVIELKTSKLLTSSDDNEFNNKAEIIGAKKKEGFNTGTPVKVTIEEQYFDYDNSEKITIIPSTGENKDYALPITIVITSIAILGAGIILIKKFVIDRK